jgi:4-amino-4-deoxy-L-arabinose transferase-like glycosyltransferase
MNALHAHLIVNHIPVLGIPFAILAFGYALIRGKGEIRKGSLWLLAILSIGTIAVYYTGDEAKESKRDWTRMEESRIETHDGAAAYALGGALFLGAIAVGCLALAAFPGSARWQRRIGWALFFCGIFVSTILARTAYTGGAIRHGEEFGKAP